MKKNSLLYIFMVSLFLLLALAGSAPADTPVSGIITSDATWTLAESPYIVAEGVAMVDVGAVLTIEPGVVVKFAPGMALRIDGELIARGTESEKITFTSNQNTPAPGDWGYVIFRDSSTDAAYDIDGNYIDGSILEYVVVEYAGGAEVDNNGAIRLNAAYPYINYSIVRNNSASGINAYNLIADNILKIENSTIRNNMTPTSDGGGIFASGIDGNIYIFNNIISYNTASSGGGIRIKFKYSSQNSTAAILNNIIRNNTASSGGGIRYSAKNITIANNIISNNSASNGGGLYPSSFGRINVVNNIISSNTASADGGGIYYLYIYSTPPITFSNNSIVRNVAHNAPAIWSRGNPDIIYNTITSNTATDTETTSAIFVKYHEPDIQHNNIFNNIAVYELTNENSEGRADLNAENNWWGTAVQSEIEDAIYHWVDDSSKALVDYNPWAALMLTDVPVSPPTGIIVTPGIAKIAIEWSENPEADIVGYKVYWSRDSGHAYANSVDVGNMTSHIINSLPEDTYYVTVTAYDMDYDPANDDEDTIVNENQTNGNESWYAEETVAKVCVLKNYYQDADGDGYGDPLSSTQDCREPDGYVTDNTDCNDDNALEHPHQMWYQDADGDGYSDGATMIQCERPSGHKAAAELTDISADCDDDNEAVNPGVLEGPFNSPTCIDGLDNDCDGQSDSADSGCTEKEDLVTGTRDIPDNAAPDSNIEVCIVIDVDEGNAPNGLIVNEFLPLSPDWTLYSAVPENSGYDTGFGEVSWLFYGNVTDGSICYDVHVPDTETIGATRCFSGNMSYNDPGEDPIITIIGGEKCLTIGYPFNKYDTDQNREIGDFELLNAIDDWDAGKLGDFELLDLIDWWAFGSYCWDNIARNYKSGEHDSAGVCQ